MGYMFLLKTKTKKETLSKGRRVFSFQSSGTEVASNAITLGSRRFSPLFLLPELEALYVHVPLSAFRNGGGNARHLQAQSGKDPCSVCRGAHLTEDAEKRRAGHRLLTWDHVALGKGASLP